MAKRSGVHWKVPTTIALAFITGLVFAIGHHLFYASLAGTPVDDELFDQQQNLAIGNGFAFLVRAALVISIGATFWQIFWRTLLNKSFPLETADALASLPSSIIDILSPKVWLASPLLVFVAAVAWLIPFSTIIPPATLTVRLHGHTNHSLMSMEIPDFLGTSMGENVLQENDDGGMGMSAPTGYYNWNTYDGPTNYLKRAVTSTAFNGELPKLPSPAVNASYVLTYPAPTIQCEAMPVSVLSSWAPVMGCDPSLPFNGVANNISACFTTPNNDEVWPYLAWAPGPDGIVPYPNNSLPYAGDLPLFNLTSAADSAYLGSYNSSAANLFIAALNMTAVENSDITWYPLNCSLYNSTYKVNFTFQEDSQTINVLDVNITHPIAPLLSTPQLLSGQNISQDVGITMNYQALIDTLGRLLIGDIAPDGTVYQTQILDTELAFTKEIYPIYTSSGFNGTEASSSQWYQRPLARAIENLFQKMTLSLFSQSEFLAVSSDNKADVTTVTLRNIYAYNWQRLWLAYGLGLGFALIVLIIGCSSLAITGASYSNKLSTVLRVTGGDRVDVDVKEFDRAGIDPLPEYLGKAKLLCMARNVSKESESESSLVIPRKPVATETSAMIQRPGSPMDVHY